MARVQGPNGQCCLIRLRVLLAATILFAILFTLPHTLAKDPREPDWKLGFAYAELQDIPIGLLWACWQSEKGVKGFEFGQRSISWEIKKFFPKKDWQMAQAARTLRRGAIDFILCNPDMVDYYGGVHKRWTMRNFLWTYRTRFVKHLSEKSWAPEDDPEQWAKNVLFFWKKYKKKRGE